jgi:hypothetical protein
MHASGKDARIVLHSLKKQLEALRGDVDHLIGEVDVGLELGGSKKLESPSWAIVISLKPIPLGRTQPSQELSSSIGPNKECFHNG